jgi:DNA-binding protein H-NS
MKLETLDALADDELRAVITRAETLLKQHDTERKDKALSDARSLLASVGLSLKDVARRGPPARAKPAYHAGRTYQHPADKSLTWVGTGKKPAWLVALEARGQKPIELGGEGASKKERKVKSETATE